MTSLLIVFFFFGIFVGSFLNVIIDRFPRNETFLKGRSYCEHCKHLLSWLDLIPVFSFLFLLGKCRYCKKFFGWWYVSIELTTGILFAATVIFLQHSHSFSLLLLFVYLIIVSSLIVIFFTDLKSGLIPDFAVALLFFSSIGLVFLMSTPLLPAVLSGLGACLFFALLVLITKGKGMGLGDVKYAFVMGFLLGYPAIVVSLYIAFLTGGVVSSILIVWKKKSLKNTIAFGPFLVAATLLGVFFPNMILSLFHLVLPTGPLR